MGKAAEASPHSGYVVKKGGRQQLIDGAVNRGLGAMANHPTSPMVANAQQAKDVSLLHIPVCLRDSLKSQNTGSPMVWLQARQQLNPGDEILMPQHYKINAQEITHHKTVEQPAIFYTLKEALEEEGGERELQVEVGNVIHTITHQPHTHSLISD